MACPNRGDDVPHAIVLELLRGGPERAEALRRRRLEDVHGARHHSLDRRFTGRGDRVPGLEALLLEEAPGDRGDQGE
ncbi:MAG TPA: hypothetical protein VJX92_22395 [Methylomirabilota bacterium]|nr:hypothetical protein [Methylomirabilota bacterium]